MNFTHPYALLFLDKESSFGVQSICLLLDLLMKQAVVLDQDLFVQGEMAQLAIQLQLLRFEVHLRRMVRFLGQCFWWWLLLLFLCHQPLVTLDGELVLDQKLLFIFCVLKQGAFERVDQFDDLFVVGRNYFGLFSWFLRLLMETEMSSVYTFIWKPKRSALILFCINCVLAYQYFGYFKWYNRWAENSKPS